MLRLCPHLLLMLALTSACGDASSDDASPPADVGLDGSTTTDDAAAPGDTGSTEDAPDGSGVNDATGADATEADTSMADASMADTAAADAGEADTAEADTASDPMERLKRRAEGIVYLPDGPLADRGAPFANPAVAGVKLRIGWRDVETAPSVYDWSELDAWVAAAWAADGFVSFSVIAGSRSPTWLLSEPGVEAIEVQRGGRTIRFPLPWSPEVLRAWTRFIAAFGARYDSEPRLAYVTAAGFGWAAETTLPSHPDLSADTLDLWSAAAAEVLLAYRDAFPTTPFTIALHNNLVPGADPQPAFDAVLSQLYDAAPGRFGLENHGLNATSSASEGSEDANIHAELRRQSPHRPVGYQMVCSTTTNDVCQPEWVRGTLAEALEAGVELGAQFIEVYANDCDQPEHQATLQHAAEALAPAP